MLHDPPEGEPGMDQKNDLKRNAKHISPGHNPTLKGMHGVGHVPGSMEENDKPWEGKVLWKGGGVRCYERKIIFG